ncbi:MAG: Gfo/Idh/MocA family oxidoreductase [Pseudomonadota bacterium]
MSITKNDPLRGAIIGYGFIAGLGHAPAYQGRKDVSITAVCDVAPGRLQEAKKKFPQARFYADYQELLRQEKDLDFVDIATPASFHAEMIHAALDQGLHILCEKPLTTTLEDATSVLAHAQKAKKVLFPCHNYKHAPVVKAIREIIHSGQIGKVKSITLSTFRNTHALGILEWNTHWRRQKKYSGGGIAMDHGSHSFYLTFDWLGSYPTAITAKMYNQQADRYDTEDNFTATLTFPNGYANLYLTWTAGVRKVVYTLQGEQGAITVDDDEMQIALMKRKEGLAIGHDAIEWQVEKRSIKSNWMDSSHVSWFNSLFDEFIVAIEKSDTMNRNLVEAWLCIQAITNAYQSANNGSVERPLLSEPKL